MILPTIVYAACIAGFLGLFALVAEHVCAELRWPRRMVWAAALAASLVLPGYSMLSQPSDADAASAMVSVPLPAGWTADAAAPHGNSAIPSPSSPADRFWLTFANVRGAVDVRWPGWATAETIDGVLLSVWAATSAVYTLALMLAAIRLRRTIAVLETRAIRGTRDGRRGDDGTVVLSDGLGPAVVGSLRPRIVLPRWLAQGDRGLLALVLAHEREHVAARDQLLSLAALAVVAVMPWNVALWWQLRRLRAAIELDCDTRVLRRGVDASRYSEALLSVRLGAGRVPFAVALTEPMSHLERRIKIMLQGNRTVSLLGVGVKSVLALSILGLAFAVNAPRAQQSTEPEAPAPTAESDSAARSELADLLRRAQTCLQDEDYACALELTQRAQGLELTTEQRAQIGTFRAAVHQKGMDTARAIVELRLVLGLPDVPVQTQRDTLYMLVQLHMQLDQHQQALEVLDDWFALTPEPEPHAHYLRAIAEYQRERFDDALTSVNRAIGAQPEADEGLYSLRMALELEHDDYEAAVATLEILHENWPSPQREEQLAWLRTVGN